MVNVVVILGCKRKLPPISQKEKEKQKEIDERHHLYSRLKKAWEIYNNIDDPEKFIICSGGGGEAEMMKEFLLSLNLSEFDTNKEQKTENTELKIILENQSRNTIENCVYTYDLMRRWYFNDPQMDQASPTNLDSLVTHLSDISLEETKGKDIDLQNLTIHLVTNDYHIKRSEIIFHHFKERLPVTPKIVCYPANISDYLQDADKMSPEVLSAIEDSKRRDLVALMNIEDALKHYTI